MSPTSPPKLGILPDLLKEELAKNRWNTLEKLAALGYVGIESNVGLDPADAPSHLARLRAQGLEICGLDVGWSGALASAWDYLQNGGTLDTGALEVALQSPLDAAATLEAGYLVLFWGQTESAPQVERLAKILNQVGAIVAGRGLRFLYHNHDHEFLKSYKDRRAIDGLIDQTTPGEVFFELDLGWAAAGGEDPAALLRSLRGRVGAVHLRDFTPGLERGHFPLIGLGDLDFPQIFEASMETGVPWIIVEETTKNRRLTPLEIVATVACNLREMGLGSCSSGTL